MSAKLSDEDFIERTRAANRRRAARQRERLINSGRTALTVWLPTEVKAALEAVAKKRGAKIADTAAALLSTALELEI